MSVPQEIIDDMNKGRHWDNVIETREEDGWIYKKMACGCEFGNKANAFGFSNHFCDEHAPTCGELK